MAYWQLKGGLLSMRMRFPVQGYRVRCIQPSMARRCGLGGRVVRGRISARQDKRPERLFRSGLNSGQLKYPNRTNARNIKTSACLYNFLGLAEQQRLIVFTTLSSWWSPASGLRPRICLMKCSLALRALRPTAALCSPGLGRQLLSDVDRLIMFRPS